MNGAGIKHIEFWVQNLEEAFKFYMSFFKIIGWERSGKTGFIGGGSEIYFKEIPYVQKIERFLVQMMRSFLKMPGPRHICFCAASRSAVDSVGDLLRAHGLTIIRGPIEMTGAEYSKYYYTVDFYGPEGFIWEVAHTPYSSH